jgi:hypothetical protein
MRSWLYTAAFRRRRGCLDRGGWETPTALRQIPAKEFLYTLKVRVCFRHNQYTCFPAVMQCLFVTGGSADRIKALAAALIIIG